MEELLEPFSDDAVFDDTYRRVAGRWQIATRRISPLMPPQLEGY